MRLYDFHGRVLGLIALIVLFAGCSDSNLYQIGGEDFSADRLGLTGRVCTDDPKEAGFPVRVIFLVDVAMGPVFADFDSELARIAALRESLSIHNGNDAFSFAVIGYAASPRLLAPEEGFFTRNPGELDNAVAMLALPQGCMSGICRDYGSALNLVRSVIEGDMSQLTAGERSRTQYTVVHMTGGRPDPWACSYECCDPSVEDCDYSVCAYSIECTQTVLQEQVIDLRGDIEDGGALSFSFHTLFLAAGTDEENDQLEPILQEMAFVGAGRFERFNIADTITLDGIGLLKLSSLLEPKAIVVSNKSTLPGLEEPQKDSDGDGMADSDEASFETDPTLWDSDGDGIGDFIEILVSLNPLSADALPAVCTGIEGPPFTDDDQDTLNECEELLIGTDGSLPDTDGDGIPDWMEVTSGTDYLHNDALMDSDGDGIVNGTELKNHTDPRASDAASHLASSYRYDIVDEGVVSQAGISTPKAITGVTVPSAGEDTSGGLGTLAYSPDPATLSWQDPQDSTAGPEVDVSVGGEFQIPSSSMGSEGLERWIQVSVKPSLMPPEMKSEKLLVEMSDRHCLSFTVRNIRLVETAGDENESGRNDVFIYFAESPAGNLTLPGLFRVAHVPVVYHPETGREPSEPLILVTDSEFVAIGK